MLQLLIIIGCVTVPVLLESNNLASNGVNGFFNSVTEGLSNLGSYINNVLDLFPNEDKDSNFSENASLNITQLVTKYGYRIEKHKVTTKDGFILVLHRICNDSATMKGRVTFLMHGILDSSDSWVLQGPGNALAYILADSGHDVWLGNARGNKHSLSHQTLKPNEDEFWNFTWEEIGIYDLPAMIDYTLNVTGEDSVYHIGHSQGTTTFFVMTSLMPEYNEKVKISFALAPVAWMTHAKATLIHIFAPATKTFGYMLSSLNTYAPSTELFNKIIMKLCGLFTVNCETSIFAMMGNDGKLIDKTLLPVIFGHMPSGSSLQQFVHYGQLVQSGEFARYDFGEELNMIHYGQIKPPNYDLKNVTVPVSLLYSGNDLLSNPIDVKMLRDHLHNVYDYFYIPEFNHLDFLYASRAKDLVYSRILDQMDVIEALGFTSIIN